MPPITTKLTDGTFTITLNRPDKLNALTAEMLARLREAMQQAADDQAVRAVLLTGAGRGFCAGQDLQDAALYDADGNYAPNLGTILGAQYNPLLRAMLALDKPIVCAVNGVAAGAGANLPFACDIVFAAKSAKFIQAFAKIGLIPDAGGSWYLPRMIGLPRAKALALFGDALPAATAAEWGLIWKAVDDDDLMDEAAAAAKRLAAGPTFSFGLTKRAMRQAMNSELDSHLDAEAELQDVAGKSADHAEGVQAFVEKRAPKFGGF